MTNKHPIRNLATPTGHHNSGVLIFHIFPTKIVILFAKILNLSAAFDIK